jgi:mRNA interferase MazF
MPVRGVVLCDQIKSLDWTVRKAEFIFELPQQTLAEVMGKASALLK